jgi:hypothetical protein
VIDWEKGIQKTEKGIESMTTDTAIKYGRKENIEEGIKGDRQDWKNNLQTTLKGKQKGEIISKLKIPSRRI